VMPSWVSGSPHRLSGRALRAALRSRTGQN
jgi:hypothetical protein